MWVWEVEVAFLIKVGTFEQIPTEVPVQASSVRLTASRIRMNPASASRIRMKSNRTPDCA